MTHAATGRVHACRLLSRVNCGSKPTCFVNAARKNGSLKLLGLGVHNPGCSRDNCGLFAVRGMCVYAHHPPPDDYTTQWLFPLMRHTTPSSGPSFEF